jgi:hypothetical protein
MSGVDDHAKHGKGQAMRRCDACYDVRLHINDGSTGTLMKQALRCRFGNRSVDTRDDRVLGFRQRLEQLLGPAWVSRMTLVVGDNRRGYDPLTRGEARHEATPDSKTDNPSAATRDQSPEHIRRLRSIVDQRDASRDPRFKCEARDGDNGRNAADRMMPVGRASDIRWCACAKTMGGWHARSRPAICGTRSERSELAMMSLAGGSAMRMSCSVVPRCGDEQKVRQRTWSVKFFC